MRRVKKNFCEILKKNIPLLLAILTSLTCKYFLNLNFYTNIFILIIGIGLYFLYKKSLEFAEKRRIIFSSIFSMIFSICYIVGKYFETNKTINGILNFHYIYIFLVLTIFMVFTTNLIIKIIDDINLKTEEIKINKLFFIILFIIFLIVIIPTFLTVYPGVLQSDTLGALNNIINGTVSTYQPILYTLIVYGFYLLGLLWNNMNIAMCLFTIIQMIAFSLSFTYTCYIIYKYSKNIYVLIGSVIFFCLCPLIPIISTILVKDALFAIFFLLFFDMSIDFILDSKKRKLFCFCYVIVGILLCLLRNQGVYIIIFTLIFYLIFIRHKKIIPILVSFVLVGYLGINKILIVSTNATTGSIAEALSVPIQQLTRVYNYSQDSMTEEEIETLYEFLPVNALNSYISEISDPVKAKFSDEYFSKNKIKFLKLWITVGLKNIDIYIDSFLYGSYAYFYIDAKMPHWGGLLPSFESQSNASYDSIGLKNICYNKSNYNKYIAYSQNASYQSNYLLGLSASIGLPIIVVFFDMCYLLYKKQYLLLAPLMFIVGLWGTLLLGPVISVRYAFPLLICVPPLVSLLFFKKEKNN